MLQNRSEVRTIDDPIVITERHNGVPIYFILVDDIPYILNVFLNDVFGWKEDLLKTLRCLNATHFKFTWLGAPTKRKRNTKWSAIPVSELVKWSLESRSLTSKSASELRSFVNSYPDFEASVRSNVQRKINQECESRIQYCKAIGYNPIHNDQDAKSSEEPIQGSKSIEARVPDSNPAPGRNGYIDRRAALTDIEQTNDLPVSVVTVKRKFDALEDRNESRVCSHVTTTEMLKQALQMHQEAQHAQQKLTNFVMDMAIKQTNDIKDILERQRKVDEDHRNERKEMMAVLLRVFPQSHK